MKSIPGISCRQTFYRVFLFLSLYFPLFAHAQLVNDGETNVLDGVLTNASGVTISTNGTFTLLVVTNGSVVTNLGQTVIGANFPATTNRLSVGGAGSAWNSSGDLYVGNSGSFNELDILAGGTVTNGNAFIAQSYSGNNSALVSDPGSLWQCNYLQVGNSGGTNNQLIISNGATVISALGYIGASSAGNNSAIVTGANSLWTNGGAVSVGAYAPRNLLIITNGGAVVSGALSGLGTLGGSSFSNHVVITDPGSIWTSADNPNYSFFVGEYSAGNELDILNGGKLVTFVGNVGGGAVSANNNFALISGPGSLWTNQLDFYIGQNGVSNRVFVTDSGALQARTLYVGYASICNQLVVSNSATVTVSNIVVGSSNAKSNSVVVAGGTITLDPLGKLTLGSYATITVNSGLLSTPFIGPDVVGQDGIKIVLNGGTLQSGGVSPLTTNVLVVGDGTDAATYEMLLEPSGTNANKHTFARGVSVSNNGLLKGFGTMIGGISVNSGGTISPGTNNAIGAITQSGSLTLNPGSTTVMKLDPSSGASDSIIGANYLTYGGTLQLTTVSGSLSSGNSFKLFSGTNYFGAFDNIVPASPGSGLRWDTYELNVDGVLRVFSVPTPAPSLSSITAAKGNLVVSATGGIPYDPCYLLISSNLINWSCIATNYFDTSGAAGFTNSIPPDVAQGYFRLQVN